MKSPDLIVVAVYLAATLGLGFACRGRQNNVDDYFTARGSFSGWLGPILIGLSIAATLFSGISFVTYASLGYSSGVMILVGAICYPISWLLLRNWFLPRFLRGGYRHPYEVIERRFGRGVRAYMSAMFVLLRIGWMAVLVYAPTIFVMGVGNLGDEWFWPLTLVIGLTCTLYTGCGGIRGVIVTDAVQFVVMGGGALYVAGFVLAHLPVGPMQVVTLLADAGRLRLADLHFSWTEDITLWSVAIGSTVANLSSFMADQMLLQRYLTAGSPAAAAKSFAINMGGAFIVIVGLVLVGLALFAWYHFNPDPLLPAKADQVLPFFIGRSLPVGAAGLLVASILAASMSSMTSGINALAGAVTNDFVAPWGRRRSPAALLRLGKRLSFAIGIVSTVTAGFARDIGTVFQTSATIMGVFVGPMLACMMFAMQRRPVARRAMVAGMVAGTVGGWAVALAPISPLWIAPAGWVATLAITAAFLRPATRAARDELDETFELAPAQD